MRRMAKMAGATAAAFMMFTGTAYAHYCTNASKEDGAGNAGIFFADVSSGFAFVSARSTVKMNRNGQIAGGFMDLHVDLNGDGAADFVFEDVYAHASLPSHAILAAGCGRGTETNIPFFVESCPPS